MKMTAHLRSQGDPRYREQRAANTRRAYERTLADPEALARRLAQTASWREANPDKRSEQYRRWRLDNAERVREKNQRRRARLLSAYVAPVDPEAIWKRDGGVCQLCRKPVDRDVPWPNQMSRTLDHVVPLSQSGAHEPANVQLAHAICNSRKGDRAA